VSVVDPANWRYINDISGWTPDAPGVLAEVYRLAPPLNIVFAEAVTVDSGSRHDVRLVLEPYRPGADEETEAEVAGGLAAIGKGLDNRGFLEVRADPIHEGAPRLEWMEVGMIESGWVHVEGWREAAETQAKDSPTAGDYDLDRAVVSADTERRILRYVFPRRGAVSVSIKHSDRPGAMRDIAGALADRELNILSSLLRRGSAPAYKAEVVVVVEPTEPDDPEAVEERVRVALDGFPPSLRVRVDIEGPVDPARVLYPRQRNEIAVRPQPPLAAAIRAVKDALPPDKTPIFISRRFIDATRDYNRRVVDALHRVLDERGFVGVEAQPDFSSESAISEEVKAKMWAGEAAIVFVISTEEPEASEFSENLAHETGFMQGQGKPLFLLVEQGAKDSVLKNANLQGLQLFEFSKAVAENDEEPESISQKLVPWLDFLDTKLGRERDGEPEAEAASAPPDRSPG
jgi:hypothetical protein